MEQLRLHSNYSSNSSDDVHLPFKSLLWASGFSFSAAKDTLLRVRYDPLVPFLFFGEEISMAAR
jgi:hypothetical protein